MANQLTCVVNFRETNWSSEDEDRLWDEMDRLSDKIVASLARSRDEGKARRDPIGCRSLLTVSSDTPDGITFFWIDLPTEFTARTQVLAICCEHLERAKHGLPNANWLISIEERPERP